MGGAKAEGEEIVSVKKSCIGQGHNMTDRIINSKQNRTRKNKGTPNIKHFSFPSFQHFENRLKKREVFLEKKNRKRIEKEM